MPARILYLHGSTAIGGAERDLLALLGRLNRSRWEPFVACPDRGPLVEELNAMGVPVCAMTFPAWRTLTQIPLRIPAAIRLIRLARAVQTAILHVNDLYWAPFGRLTGQWCGIPCVVSIRQDLKPERVRQYHLDRADMAVTMAKSAGDTLVAGGIARQRVRLIPSGVDTERFTPEADGPVRVLPGISQDVMVLGCIANVSSVKGHDVLVHALSKLTGSFPQIHCLIVGRHEGTYGVEVRRLADQLGVAERLHFVGFQADVRPYLAAMDVVVLPSRAEALGIVLLEAMAMAKPVVATKVGGIPDVVEHGVTGLLVPPSDADAVADAVEVLLNDPEKRQRMGQAGRRRVLERFRLDQTVTALDQLYQELLTARKG